MPKSENRYGGRQVYSCVEQRNYRNTDSTPFKNWKAVKRAEMLRHEKAYPNGYLAGTNRKWDIPYSNQRLSQRIWKQDRDFLSVSIPTRGFKENLELSKKYCMEQIQKHQFEVLQTDKVWNGSNRTHHICREQVPM